MTSSNQDLITLFQKRQVDYLVRFCNADLLAAVDAVVEEMEGLYTSEVMEEDDYSLSREEFDAKMPIHMHKSCEENLDGNGKKPIEECEGIGISNAEDEKLLTKKIIEKYESVEQAISAVVVDHFMNLDMVYSHGVTEENQEVKVLIRNQPQLHAVFSSGGIAFEEEGNVQRWWGSTDSLEFLRKLSVVFKIIERLIEGYTKEDKEIVDNIYKLAGKKHSELKAEKGPFNFRIVPFNSGRVPFNSEPNKSMRKINSRMREERAKRELPKKALSKREHAKKELFKKKRAEKKKERSISWAELDWVKKQRSLYSIFHFEERIHQVPLLQASYPEVESCPKQVGTFGETASDKSGFSVSNIVLGPMYDAIVNLIESSCLHGIWVRRCPVCSKVFTNVNPGIDIRKLYCSDTCLDKGRSSSTVAAKEGKKKNRKVARKLGLLLSKGKISLGVELTASEIRRKLWRHNDLIVTSRGITGMLGHSGFHKMFEEETAFGFKLERRKTDKAKEFCYIFSRNN